MLNGRDEGGFTLTELVIGLLVLAVVAFSLTGLFTSLVHSAVIAKEKAVASTLATNQMEYLKSLPYDSLAVAGGSIYSSTYIPASSTQTINGVKYTIKTSISYIDDAYDGCGSYPTQQLKQTYCRNYPPPAGAPATDTNPADYKIADVTVFNPDNVQLAEVDTQISAKVAETASTTGALFVSVVDNNGNPISGATVNVVNNSTGPVNVSDATDENGIAIFYGLPNDSNTHYVITASDSGYSTLYTINASGSLQPTYPNQKILSQQSSYVTLVLKLQGTNSLLLETTDVNGNPLAGVKVYVKGGYKSYTSSSDTTYYYDTLTPSDTRPTTDSNGFAGLLNLVPGTYIFCGDNGDSNCKIGATQYYLIAAVPYGGSNSLAPITVPTYDPTNPPTTTYSYAGTSYLQEVRLMLSTNANLPRIFSLSPYDVSLSGGTINNFQFTVSGQKLSCGTSGSGCSSSVRFVQGGNTYTATCTGASAGVQLNCSVNLTGIGTGNAQLVVGTSSGSVSLPFSPQMGGLSVTP